MSDGWRLMIICDIQLVMGNQLLVWSDERLVLGNSWSMVSDRFIGNEWWPIDGWSLICHWWVAKSRKWWVKWDAGRMIDKCRWLIIDCLDSLWVTFEGDGGVVWWVIGDRSRIIDDGWWIFGSRVSGMDHHIGKWWTIVDSWWLMGD